MITVSHTGLPEILGWKRVNEQTNIQKCTTYCVIHFINSSLTFSAIQHQMARFVFAIFSGVSSTVRHITRLRNAHTRGLVLILLLVSLLAVSQDLI